MKRHTFGILLLVTAACVGCSSKPQSNVDANDVPSSANVFALTHVVIDADGTQKTWTESITQEQQLKDHAARVAVREALARGEKIPESIVVDCNYDQNPFGTKCNSSTCPASDSAIFDLTNFTGDELCVHNGSPSTTSSIYLPSYAEWIHVSVLRT